jgi:tetratricopeptide (TPR) repeat protein
MLASRSISQSPHSEAYEAFWKADFHRALALLHNVTSPGAAATRARSLIRLGRFDRAALEYERSDLSRIDPHEATLLAIVAAEARASLSDNTGAEEALGKAFDIAKRNSSRLLHAFSAQTASVLAFYSGNVGLSRQMLEKSLQLSLRLKEGGVPEQPYEVTYSTLRLRQLNLLSWHAAFRGDHQDQEAQLLNAATLAASESRNRDRYLETQLLMNVAIIVGMRPFECGRQHLAARLQSFPWSLHTSVAEIKIRCALMNNSRLFHSGREDEITSLKSAPSLAARFAERADTLLFGNWIVAQDFLKELRYCVSVALDVDWTNPGAETPHLLSLAALVAPFDVELARKAQTMFEAAFKNLPRTLLGRHCVGRQGEQLSQACIDKASVSYGSAADQFRKAREAAKSDWPLTAIAGIESYTISRCSSDLDAAHRFIARFPGSSFSRRLKRALHNIDQAAPGDFPYLGMYGIPVPGVGSVGAA